MPEHWPEKFVLDVLKRTRHMSMIRRTASYIYRTIRRVLATDPDRFLQRVPGVIHVGANTGQERDRYRLLGLRVIWIEPIPEVFEELTRNIRDIPGQRAVRALVTDRDGAEYDFHIATNQGASSSILDLKEHRGIWPDVGYRETIQLTSATLDALLAREGISPSDYPALVLDVQGAELLVLQGATGNLPAFQYIKLEVADFESYAGCCQVGDVAAFMRRHGFREAGRTKFAARPGVGAYYNIVYARR
jgi:FkbM family methyltransferase